MTGRTSRLFVKLCGFARPADVADASDLDIDALGFVLADDARVPLDPSSLSDLLRACHPRLTRVAVVGPKTIDECRHVLSLGFDAVQVVVTDWFLTSLDGKAVVPVLFDGPDVEQRLTTGAGDVPPNGEVGQHGSGLVCIDGPTGGGQGRRADWSRAARVARSWPLLLAGGLREENVGEAISQVRPRGVDVSSGIESSPGVKDQGRMAAFVAAVRAAERELC